MEWVAESSYFFALSKFREPIVAHIEAHPEFIRPASRRNEALTLTLALALTLTLTLTLTPHPHPHPNQVLAFMKDGLRDLSISRTTFGWGVPVPDQQG